jgi:hypothetical protein
MKCDVDEINRWRFFQGIAAKRVREAGKLAMQFRMCVSRSFFQDLGLPLDRWMFEPKI